MANPAPDLHARPALPVRAFVGLGSNLGDPAATLRMALDALEHLANTRVTGISPIFRTAPIGFTDQPEFLNAVARLSTQQAPAALLRSLQDIEQKHGRERSFPNAPRTLDLDLLLYGELVSHDVALTLPHPRMHERAFVLIPLLELDANVDIPGYGAASHALQHLQGRQQVAPA